MNTPLSIGARRLQTGQRSQRGNGATGTPELSPSGTTGGVSSCSTCRADRGPDGGEQPRLGHRFAERARPVIEPEHEGGQLRQLDGRADAEGVHQLARAQLADVAAIPHEASLLLRDWR